MKQYAKNNIIKKKYYRETIREAKNMVLEAILGIGIGTFGFLNPIQDLERSGDPRRDPTFSLLATYCYKKCSLLKRNWSKFNFQRVETHFYTENYLP